MTDFILAPGDLGIASAMPNLDANTSSFSSPTVGSTRTAERLGDRLRFQMNFTTVNDDPSLKRQRGRLISTLMSLRGQSGRVWMTPPGATLRGSFPAGEMFVNNDFSNGVASWAPDSGFSLAALDRGARATRLNMVGSNILCSQAVTKLAGIPYCIRGFVSAGLGIPTIWMSDNATASFGPIQQGMIEGAYTAPGSSSQTGFFDFTMTGELAGYFADFKWTSFSRCALVDNGVNSVLNSDTPGTGTGWSLTAATASSGAATDAPDGTLNGWSLTETATTAAHFASQVVTVGSGAADFTESIFVKASLRSWMSIQVFNGTATSGQWYNLSSGALGSASIGAGISLIGAQCIDYGNGWKRCIFTFRKTDAATSLTLSFVASTGDLVSSYAGSTASKALFTWRASFAQSSVPVSPVATTGAAVTGTLQTGTQLKLKGLPFSSQGLLLNGDWIECNSQLNQMAAQLDSDPSGLGTAVLTRPPRNSPVDNTGFVVNTPMGKFMVSSNSTGWNEAPGRLSDASLELIEDIAF